MSEQPTLGPMLWRTTVSGRPANVAYVTKDWAPSDKDHADYAKVVFDDGDMAILVMPKKEEQQVIKVSDRQYSDYQIATAQAMLDDPKRLAKMKKKYGANVEAKLRAVLAKQKPRGPSSKRPSLMQQLQNESLADQVRMNAWAALPFGKGFGR